MAKHGFSDDAWEAAKAQGKAALVECARAKKVISYTDFIHHICSISFETPYDSRLLRFLAEISTEEAKAGRGMMTALVVRKNGDQRPGGGFFGLAERLGYDVSDREKFWLGEVDKVFVSWQKEGPPTFSGGTMHCRSRLAQLKMQIRLWLAQFDSNQRRLTS